MGSVSLVSHWNMLVDMCCTEYLVMASDDDVYDDKFLMEIDELAKEYPNVNLFRAGVRKIDANGDVVAEDFPSPAYENQVNFLFDWFCFKKISCIANYVFNPDNVSL